jgi:hypothetical protein
MPQTLLAILSMMIVSMFSLNQHRNLLSTRESMMRMEISLQATGVAVDWLEEIGTLSFDEATRDDEITSVNDLTAMVSINLDGDGKSHIVSSGGDYYGFDGDTPSDDIDDFDETAVPKSRATIQGNLNFSLYTNVVYVDDTNVEIEQATPTKTKKATVTVISLDVAQPDTIRLSQVYTCGSRCNW